MPDISELNLKITKDSALKDLKAVEKQLEKTGSAADGLIEGLKNIGLSVGFGFLIKESFMVNQQLNAIEKRMKTIFGTSFDSNAISELSRELNVSTVTLTSLLTLTGQFAKGMGQGATYIKEFSSSLTQAAINYSSFLGKTSDQDFSDVARKFAKATLGEVGELKEIGIIVDVNTLAFKNHVKAIQEATGASEAQARQQAITNEILAQVDYTSGSAQQNMYDGWTQLNRIISEFQNVLGKTGEIFSTVFGPILKSIGDIISLPLVSTTLGWTVAVGGLLLAWKSVTGTLKTIASLLEKTGKEIAISNFESKELLKSQKEILNFKLQIFQSEARILRLQRAELELKGKLTASEADELALINEKIKAAYKQERLLKKEMTEGKIDFIQTPNPLKTLNLTDKDKIKLQLQAEMGYNKEASRSLQIAQEALRGLNISGLETSASFSLLSDTFLQLISSTKGQEIANNKVIRLTSAKAIGEKIYAGYLEMTNLKQSLANIQLKSFSSILSGIGSKLKSAGIAIQNYVSTLLSAATGSLALKNSAGNLKKAGDQAGKSFSSIATIGVFLSGLVGTAVNLFKKAAAGLVASLTSLWAAIYPVIVALGALVIAFDAIKIVANAIKGNDWHAGTIVESIAKWIVGFDEIEERTRQINEENKRVRDAIKESKNLSKELEQIKLDRLIKNMLPTEVLDTLYKEAGQHASRMKELEWMVNNMKAAQDQGKFTLEEGQTRVEKQKELQKELNDITQKYYASLDKIKAELDKNARLEEEYSNLLKEAAEFKIERNLKEAIPEEAINILKNRLQGINDSFTSYQMEYNKLHDYLEANPDERKNHIERLTQLQNKLLELEKERFTTEDAIAEQQRRLRDLNVEFSKELKTLGLEFMKLNEVFSYHYDSKNVFTNDTQEIKAVNLTNELNLIKDALNSFNALKGNDVLKKAKEELEKSLELGDIKDADFMKKYKDILEKQFELGDLKEPDDMKTYKELLEKQFELVREQGEIRLATLAKEREAAISNLNTMMDLVAQAREFRATSIQGVEASSSEALSLQSRQRGDVNQNALKPIIDQQKAVKDVETKMLDQQKKSVNSLTKITSALQTITKKIGTSSGATNFDVVTVI